MNRVISLACVVALSLGGCMMNPKHIAQDKYDKTQSKAEASLPEPCAPGEARTYRPTPKTDRPDYDTVIPPTADISTRAPSECRRRK